VRKKNVSSAALIAGREGETLSRRIAKKRKKNDLIRTARVFGKGKGCGKRENDLQSGDREGLLPKKNNEESVRRH